MKTDLRVATVQFQHKAGDKAYNLATMENFIHQAAKEQVKILAFPEMCLTGYWHVPKLPAHAVRALAEPVATSAAIGQVAHLAQAYDMAIGVGLIEEAEDGRLYNAYVVCMPDGTKHVHRKIHAFEHPEFSRGEQFTVFDSPWGARIGILICWDNNLVENARAMALLGTEILIAPHQTGGTHSRSPYGMKPIPKALWENRHRDPQSLRAAFAGEHGRGWLMRWLPSRAHDNGLFILFSNGVGLDDDEIRTGNAMIIDPYGRIVAESDAITDDMVTCSIDLSLIPLSTGRRWIYGRRPELYGLLTQKQGYERDAHDARFSDEPTAISKK